LHSAFESGYPSERLGNRKFGLHEDHFKMTLLRRLLIAIALVLLTTGCSTALKTSVDARAIPQTTTLSLPMVFALPNYPLSITDRATTNGLQYLANLNGRLAALPKNPTPHSRAVQAGILYQRFQALGKLQDLDDAYEILNQLTADPAADADALILAATVASYLHEFDAAVGLLDRVDKLALGTSSAELRLEIANARTMAPLAPVLAPGAGLINGQEYRQLVQLANECIDRGDLGCASNYFHDAQFVYSDVAPLPLAWLHTQQGITLLRFDQPELAIRFFRSAMERLPGYSLAIEHLAQCLVRAKAYGEARKLYLELIAQTQNPEDMAGLAILENQAGNRTQANQWLKRAKTAYAARLQKYPEAYAQHAVKFYLLIGDINLASNLAEGNFKRRTDVSAYLMLASVRLAQSNPLAACILLRQVLASGRHPPELSALHQQLSSCT
jgi:tetratricopeptide (TPR) repeat protein